MARYQITCRTMSEASTPSRHEHIVAVGIPAKKTVKEVYLMIDSGNSFFTKSPSTGKEAEVHKFKCHVCHSYDTLRSVGDVVTDNNLDNLKNCP